MAPTCELQEDVARSLATLPTLTSLPVMAATHRREAVLLFTDLSEVAKAGGTTGFRPDGGNAESAASTMHPPQVEWPPAAFPEVPSPRSCERNGGFTAHRFETEAALASAPCTTNRVVSPQEGRVGGGGVLLGRALDWAACCCCCLCLRVCNGGGVCGGESWVWLPLDPPPVPVFLGLAMEAAGYDRGGHR